MSRDVWGWRGEEDDVGLEVGVVEGGQGGRLDVQHANLEIDGFCLQYFSKCRAIFTMKIIFSSSDNQINMAVFSGILV